MFKIGTRMTIKKTAFPMKRLPTLIADAVAPLCLFAYLSSCGRKNEKPGGPPTKKVPNYLDYIYFDGLKSVKPEALRILR